MRDANGTGKLVTIAYYRKAVEVFDKCAVRESRWKESLSVKIDRVVLNRFLGPLILAGVLYILYYLSIGKGYQLTNYTWPLLAAFRNFVAQLLPGEGILFDPTLRTIILSVLDGLLAVINYVPIFAMLFSIVAILEDIGYVPRMAFIMDRVLNLVRWAVRISHGIGRSQLVDARPWYHGTRVKDQRAQCHNSDNSTSELPGEDTSSYTPDRGVL